MKKVFAANVTYSGNTFTTKVLVEYAHTGKIYEMNTPKGKKQLSGIESAKEQKAKRKKVLVSDGFWYIDRIAIPTITANGKSDWWYITNPGDSYRINKCSKAWNKFHEQVSEPNFITF